MKQTGKSVFGNARNRTNALICIIFSSLFIFFSILALINPGGIYGENARVEAMMENAAASLLPLILVAFHYLMHLDFSPLLTFVWLLFSFMALCLGSAFEFYYIFDWWDIMLHTVSGLLQSMTFYGLLECIFRNNEFKGKQCTILFLAFMASMACASLWEIVEFSADTLVGSNTQKTIPILEGFTNRTSTFEPLKASIESIGQFYRQPSGYRFALMDTMEDMFVCFLGSIAFQIIMGIRALFGRREVMTLFFRADAEPEIHEE